MANLGQLEENRLGEALISSFYSWTPNMSFLEQWMVFFSFPFWQSSSTRLSLNPGQGLEQIGTSHMALGSWQATLKSCKWASY
jgi:hypothetical protein